MRNHQDIQNKFRDYLSRKLNPSQAQNIVFSNRKTDRLSDISSPRPSYTQQSNRTSSTLSMYSIDSSNINFSNSIYRTKRSNGSSNKTASKKKRLIKLKDLQQGVCSICLQQYKDRVHMSCKHSYCHQCLKQWLKTSSTCPYCRTDCEYYFHNGDKIQIEKKQFQYEEQEQYQQGLDFECYMCQQTNQGDQVLICDQCQLYACHIRCDPRLRGIRLRNWDPWYCHFCS